MTDLYIEGQKGLGDNLFLRPFVRAACHRHRGVWLETPWPQLYWDMPGNLHFVREATCLRTQRKNMESVSAQTWSSPPASHQHVKPLYSASLVQRFGSITRAYESFVPLGDDDFDFELGIQLAWTHEAASLLARFNPSGKPFAVVRPATLRAEWCHRSRSPLQTNLQVAVDELKRTHFLIGVADLQDGEEWLDGGDLMGLDLRLYRGELDVTTMAALFNLADVVLTAPGFAVPLAQATRTPCVAVFGGSGALNHPSVVTDTRITPDWFFPVTPEPMCMCDEANHPCAKEIDPARIRAAVRMALEVSGNGCKGSDSSSSVPWPEPGAHHC
jgi:hypothetical protein